MTARALRLAGYDGRICLIGDEALAAYDRPSLSKAVLAGEQAQAPTLLEADWYADNDVELLLGQRVVAIDPQRHLLEIEGSAPLSYDKLVLATGAHAREMNVPGIGLAGIHRLRRHVDSVALRTALQPGSSLVVVGGGLIGCEVATTARKAGVDVTLLEAADELLTRVLGRRIGSWCRGELEKLGVKIELRAQVARFEGHGRVEAVVCADGRKLAADVVLVSIGAAPADELARAAGIACERGVIVDATGASACADVYAVGDVAAWPLRGGGQRSLETFLNSQAQAEVVAAALLGRAVPAPQVPTSWTEIAGHRIQMVGDPEGPGDMVTRGDVQSGSPLVVFRVTGGHVEGAIAIDASREFSTASRLVNARTQVSAAPLNDPAFNLRDLLKPAAKAQAHG
jgi:NAD(P)H-nitrite reductase large subunit